MRNELLKTDDRMRKFTPVVRFTNPQMDKSVIVIFALLLFSCQTSAFSSSRHDMRMAPSFSSLQLFKNDEIATTTATADESDTTELDRLKIGWNELVSGEAFDGSDASRLIATPEDFMGVVGHFPLVFESLRTAFTGQISTSGYMVCAAASFLTGMAHLKMTVDTPRDFRAPRLAEYRTVYEFSGLYLIPFSWMIWRITEAFPKELEAADPIMSFLFSLVTIYGFAYAAYGKKLLDDVNNKDAGYEGILLPSSKEYQAQAQLYLTGNIAINGLACLFIPFVWTLTIRGTEWWERIQHLYPNQAAFLGVSLLVATVGDVSGNFLLRLKELDMVKSQRSIVVMGILSNIGLLLVPEFVFNGIYSSGVSEVGFYFE